MTRLILMSLLLATLGCSIDRSIAEVTKVENDTLNDFIKLPDISRLRIAEQNEPGEKLMLCLTIVNKENKEALRNQPVKFYHTNTNGNYNQTNPNDESSARLSGQSVTNNKGQIYIETILPGDYGSSADNRHIHTTVYGAKPEAYDIHFGQYTSYMGRRFIEGSDQHFLADLKRTRNSSLVSFLMIEIKSPAQYEG